VYTWQRTALARIEVLPGKQRCTEPQYESARNLFYAIGTRHFPDPKINLISTDTISRLVIRWLVDDREWTVTIAKDGTIRDSMTSEKGEGVIQSYTMTREAAPHVLKMVRWLLLGDEAE